MIKLELELLLGLKLLLLRWMFLRMFLMPPNRRNVFRSSSKNPSNYPSPSTPSGPGFKDSGSKSSLWNKNFPFSDHVEKYLCDEADLNSTREIGIPGLCRMFMAHGLRIASVACHMEKHALKAGRAFNTFEKEKQKMISSIKTLEDQVKLLKIYLQASTDQVSLLEREKADLEELVKRKNAEVEALTISNNSLSSEALEQHIMGFDKAIQQTKFFHPELNLNNYCASKMALEWT